jgi:RNA polymerase sigma-70 factor, ECF subfamily
VIVSWRRGAGDPARADPDAALVDRARRGDLDAFDDLVRKYQDRLVNYLRALVGHADDAEDLAQDAFIRAYRGLARFAGRSLFRTWLYQIATNVARTHRARRSKGSNRGQTPVEPLAERDEPTSPVSLEAQIVLRDRLDRALAALPAEWREAVVLRDVEGLEYREIAELTGVPIGTVESRIFRGRQRLRAALQPGGAEDESSGDGPPRIQRKDG